MRTLIFCCLLIFLAQIATAQSEDVDALKHLNQDWLNSITHKDSATLAKILADDFKMVNPMGKSLNKKDNLASVRSPGIKFISIAIDSENIRILTPEIAIISCWLTFKSSVEGNVMTGKNCYQDIYMKRENTWLAVSAHVTLLSNK
jgi:uncharacterized protein (TIGR02246 family)